MKSRISVRNVLLVFVLLFVLSGTFLLSACSLSDIEPVGTLQELGYADEEPTMEEFVTLSDIYFPEGILDTGLGMYIWDKNSTNPEDEWVRTDTEEGRALFDPAKSTMFSIHGMGWNAGADDPEVFEPLGYNVLCFQWGCYADEVYERWTVITNSVWLADNKSRWEDEDENWHNDDFCNVSCAEIFGAYYYDLFSHFPNYSGAVTHIFGHSYGAMMTIASLSLLTTAYRSGLIPAYMLPNMITMLDPYLMACESFKTIAWLGNATPINGNILEVAYQTSVVARELGITIRFFRISQSVAYLSTLSYVNQDISDSYWKFMNNIIYVNVAEESKTTDLFTNFLDNLHNYGWDWFTEYYTDTMLYDANATLTQEPAFCFKMPYDLSFARYNVKYTVNLNNTKENVDDDIVTSFCYEYNHEHNDSGEPGYGPVAEEYIQSKSKIAGFVYVDNNENGIFDEMLQYHFAGAVVIVKDAEGNVVSQTTTGVNGYYEAVVDTVGTYTVEVHLPAACRYHFSDSTSVRYDFLSRSTKTISVEIVDAAYQCVVNNFGIVR